MEKEVVVYDCSFAEIPLQDMPDKGHLMDLRDWLCIGRNTALHVSNNTGRPVDEWEIHDASGRQLDPEHSASSQKLKDGDRVFLNLKVGVGGNVRRRMQARQHHLREQATGY